jgi:peptidoglycan/LPS O-acetylase OafA/YrhL
MASPTTTAPQEKAPRTTPTGTAVRTDIQGLRAIAVSMVLLYHLWPGRLTGGFAGVDVFFVISGFLITSHLLAHPPSRGRNLLEFWSRRIRRLLPAALLVLALTLVGTWLWAPGTVWSNSAKDVRAAALYFVNWRFASQSVNYLAAENAPSPVEHFWSLSVEEQFYLMWPILILLVVALAKWRRWRLVPVTMAGLSLVVAASLAYSIYQTHAEPASAYFVTPTRIWELGIGGLVATALSRRALGRDRDSEAVPLPVWARVVLTWLGLAAMVWTAFVYTASTPFPGYEALLPVLGTAAVIAAMPPRALGSPAGLMAWRPVQWLGDVSYSVYLWHWPMIVLVPYATGHSLSRLDKLAIIVATLVLAGLTKRYIEDRFRTAKWGRPLIKPYLLGAAAMAVVVAGSAALIADLGSTTPVKPVLGGCVGAAALAPGSHCANPTDAGPLLESPTQAGQDRSDAYGYPGHPATCFANQPDFPLTVCHFGDPNAKVKVALVGNSHAGEWLPALQQIIKDQGWSLTTYLASRCANADILQKFDTSAHSQACLNWTRQSTDAIASGGYNLVVMTNRISVTASGTTTIAASQQPYAQGYASVLRKFTASGAKVVGIRDTPAPGNPPIPDCLGVHSSDYSACDFSRAAHLPAEPLTTAIAGLNDPNITEADLTEYVCPKADANCPAVVGRLPVYFDNSHLSGAFSATLAPYLEPYLVKAVRH